MSANEPAPGVIFQDYLRAGEFRLQECHGCSRMFYFPRTVCPHCGQGELRWLPVSGHGVVYSTTIVRQRPERGGDYNISLIDLDEGVRMMSRVEGIPPQQVRIGMRVEALISKGEGAPLVLFRPESQTQ